MTALERDFEGWLWKDVYSALQLLYGGLNFEKNVCLEFAAAPLVLTTTVNAALSFNPESALLLWR